MIYQKAIFVEAKFSLTLCRDPNDDKFIDCAILGKVNYLVSEDKDIIDDEKLKKQLFEYSIYVRNGFEFYQEIMKNINL
ncbi:putative toxin-antitoxin system toxin component, PIN family [candidate division KSB1 bacterium]|nr:putative toxin-antitoxin system toxin component, PIN family [candidate division KSB1 bacterium]